MITDAGAVCEILSHCRQRSGCLHSGIACYALASVGEEPRQRHFRESTSMRSTIFISYSSKDKEFCDELLPALKAVADIRQQVWRDREEIDVGDRFHPAIQEALAGARLAIVLVSNHVLTSRYVMQHELPVLLRMESSGALKLGILYVSAVAEAALTFDIDGDRGRRPVDLGAIHSFNTWQQPLKRTDEGERDLLYARVADWAASASGAALPSAAQAGATRHDLAIFIEARHDHSSSHFRFHGSGW
ncbi:MAG: toll/interleukin-1 receptor domain-containing protein [Candidatus Accumulibacter sp.]|nr:toll/interleukin-1 receptor domain-containing protein [Accumulibacter sp.]MBO3708813.1 toll/interleukin-1 receptor domain-containing protein [Candidatus Accumulibacter conexus]